MTEQIQPTTTVDSNSDSNNLIHEIALTNQISVPWEELRTVLKLRLDQVLQSDQLIYTEPSVTNPLTTRLAPLPSDNVGQVDIQTPLSLIEPVSLPVTPVASQEPVLASQNPVEDQDQAHVPEQPSTESNQEQTQEVSTESDQTPEQGQKVEENGEETKIETGSNTEDNTKGEKAASENFLVSSEENRPESGVTATAGEASQNGPRMVPISKDTLLVETPQGYHVRINALLDAFSSPPFTIQRICELLHNPTEHHSNLIKYLRAVEKVLMITSSINEFSNPAYNGPSALDEASSNDDGEKHKESTTANGDYSRATNLDFSLISEKMPSSISDALQEGQKVHDENIDESTVANVPEDVQIADKNDGDSGMDVEKTTTGSSAGVASDMDVDSSNAVNNMDGVEDEANTSQDNGQNESNDIQVDSEVDGGMELDQA
ncbi:protein phosphatase 4, regulatory subunit 2 [Mortierella sp. AM989]|nr:protein phosphatase 4, regulatory subunit 2 [Mortierella sp. AM989]